MALGLFGATYCVSVEWPHWANEVFELLSCNMPLNTFEENSGHELAPNSAMAELGTHVIRGDNVDIWLRFEKGQLQSYLLTKLQGYKGVYVSPRTNLCTGDLTFLLRLSRPHGLEGARVSVNGTEVTEFPWGAPYEVPGGKVEIRVEHDGYQPITRRLVLDANDAGEQRLSITSEDLRPALSL